MSRGTDGCEVMCCGRGYDTTRIKRITKCECKFKWCCAVECKNCEEAVDIHTCKAPKRAEWLDQTWDTPTSPRSSGFCPRHSGIWSPSLAFFLPCLLKSLLFVAWLYLKLFCESTTTEIYISHERLAHFAQYGRFFSLSFSLFVFVLNWSEDGKSLRFKNKLCRNMLVYFWFRFDVRILFCECCFVTKGVLLLK